MNSLSSSLMFRRFYCLKPTTTPAAVGPSSSRKKSLVFLGSPQVSVTVLDALLNASNDLHSQFHVAAIVTQPPSVRDRGRKMMPSPVAQHALDRGFPSDLIFTPERAGEETFLSRFKALQPEVCITAAYGNILPSKFLTIPQLGTVNVHPSLLPLYRGAAPVQRALQDGVKETGVSLLFTIRALDAGPVISFEKLAVDDYIKAPELLSILFGQGSRLLIRELPSIFDGSASMKAQPQDNSIATLAPKITPEESWLSFNDEAAILHNKVRAFAGWPGTRARVQLEDVKNGKETVLDLKILTTRVCKQSCTDDLLDKVTFNKVALVFPCGGHTALEVLQVQQPGKKAVDAGAFWNGLRGQKLKIARTEATPRVVSMTR